jgi:hypothetical protein
MAVCQWKIQREALTSLSPKQGPSSMHYNNSGDDSSQRGRSSIPEISQEQDIQGHMTSERKGADACLLRLGRVGGGAAEGAV